MNENKLLSKIISILFWILSILILFSPLKTNFNSYDEGFAVFNATRILDGDIPYRDFWTIYPPGQFYVLSFIFKLFGESLLISRLFDTLIRFILVFTIWIISKRLSFGYLSYLATVITSIIISSINAYSYVILYSIALGLISIVFFINFLNSNKGFWLSLSGIVVGIIFVFRWDIGIYFFLSISTSIVISKASKFIENNFSLFFHSFFKNICLFTFPIIIIFIIVYGLIIYVSGFSNFVEQVFFFPLVELHEVRGLPYPSFFSPLHFIMNIFSTSKGINVFQLMNWHLFYFPLLIYILSFIFLYLFWIKKKEKLGSQMLIKLTLSILGLLLFAQALSRFDYVHVFPTLLISSVIYFSFFSGDSLMNLNKPKKILIYLVLPGFFCFNFFVPVLQLSNYKSVLNCFSYIQNSGCVEIMTDQEQAVEYIKTYSEDSEKIFVGNQRHDQIFVNDIGFYFLSNRQSVTKYSELYPGIATTLEVQKVIAEDIEAERINWVVLVNSPLSYEPNNSSKSSGIKYLDNYIHANFYLVEEFGNYKILRKMENK